MNLRSLAADLAILFPTRRTRARLADYLRAERHTERWQRMVDPGGAWARQTSEPEDET